jgi:hypothetical protein
MSIYSIFSLISSQWGQILLLALCTATKATTNKTKTTNDDWGSRGKKEIFRKETDGSGSAYWA